MCLMCSCVYRRSLLSSSSYTLVEVRNDNGGFRDEPSNCTSFTLPVQGLGDIPYVIEVWMFLQRGKHWKKCVVIDGKVYSLDCLRQGQKWLLERGSLASCRGPAVLVCKRAQVGTLC